MVIKNINNLYKYKYRDIAVDGYTNGYGDSDIEDGGKDFANGYGWGYGKGNGSGEGCGSGYGSGSGSGSGSLYGYDMDIYDDGDSGVDYDSDWYDKY